MKRRIFDLFLVGVLITLTGCAAAPSGTAIDASSSTSTVSQTQSHKEETSASSANASDGRRGYLSLNQLPDSSTLIPPPPAEGSAAMAHDEEVSKEYLKLRDTKRWEQAAHDAEFIFPDAFYGFSCIIGIPITETDTPTLFKMLRKVAFDAGYSTYKAKMKYNRPRPFLINNEPICTPEEKGSLTTNGSYPSGHTAVGWAWGLVLAEVSPEQSDAIIALGRAFGESRIVCNVHWQSDVNEGRFMAAATVARLHGEPAFRTDLRAARAEIEAARAKGLKPISNCE